MKSVLKLGTRKSLLAWAQSQAIASEVEHHNPGLRVELVGIETRGDMIQDRSLSQVASEEGGKEFFVAEIDQALRSGLVDLTVHSLKDLSLKRPTDLSCAAIPRRENPRDVVLYGPRALERLRLGLPLKIGTSSPRRLENLPAFLRQALPRVGSDLPLKLEFIEIRGNIHTRLSRVHLNPNSIEDSDRYLDGVVLAFAGLIRLWRDRAGKAELEVQLRGVRWMVLPLAECPAAPGQGALAVECRADDTDVLAALEKLHDPHVERQIARERLLLEESGGGCHQRFGATVTEHQELGSLMFVRGKDHLGHEMKDLQWDPPSSPLSHTGPMAAWDGSQWKGTAAALLGFQVTQVYTQAEMPPAIFIAQARAVQDPSFFKANTDRLRLWTSGVGSWFKLAQMGLWIEGCAEGLGFDYVRPILSEPVLGLPALNKWSALTHAAAIGDWQELGMGVIATYRLQGEYEPQAQKALADATHVFWASGSQYDALKKFVNSGAIHACGPGKTAQWLKRQGIQPLLFPTVQEWKLWLRTH